MPYTVKITMGRKANQSTLPKVNEELKGFSVGINPFGEITSSYDINKLNIFLDTRVEDKKFKEVNDFSRNIDSVTPELDDFDSFQKLMK